MKTIVYTTAAAKDLDGLPLEVRSDIEDALDVYAQSGRGDVKALQGVPGYRLRVGRYRVLFAEDRVTILAISISKRETTTYRRN